MRSAALSARARTRDEKSRAEAFCWMPTSVVRVDAVCDVAEPITTASRTVCCCLELPCATSALQLRLSTASRLAGASRGALGRRPRSKLHVILESHGRATYRHERPF